MVIFFIYIILSSFFFCNENYVNVITTNDIHGFIDKQKANFINPQYPPTIIGSSGLYEYVDRLKNENNKLLLLDAGNFFQGHPLGIADSGSTIIKWMNKLGYHGFVPGNYDFLFGVENLVKLSEKANFDFLGANLYFEDSGQLVFKPYNVIEIDDLKLGIIGIINPNLENLVLSNNLKNIFLKDPIVSLRNAINDIKEKVDIMLLLTSAGVPWDREEVYFDFVKNINSTNNTDLNAMQLGYYADGIDVIISGGISKGYNKPWYDPKSHVYIFQNYGNGTSFGHFMLDYDYNSKLFTGYNSGVRGSATQTLFLNDFRFNEEIYEWINTLSNESINDIYKKTDWSSSEIPDSYGLKYQSNNINDNWEFPNLNKEENIDIITWNCEFFPTANDSTIESLSEAIYDFNVDIIAFQEIKNRGWFSKLMKLLPEYDFIISQQSSFMDQAIIYKKNDFVLVGRVELFAEKDYNFAGRPPLKIDLIHKESDLRFSVINLHMKCCDSGLSRRIKASEMLYDYLINEIEHNKNLIVLGDWNDDLKDKEGEHCFQPFLDDNRFFFPTFDLTYDLSKASYPKEPYVSFLDHILVSNELINKNDYEVDTVPIDKYMGNFEVYEKYISDHMPIYLSFSY